MPNINSNYKSPAWLKGRHVQTIVPSLLRKVKGVIYCRERISTHDGDFLDLDWSPVGSRKLVILSHGMEGSSHQHYILGMVKEFNQSGWDALAWNFRGCSGHINAQKYFYHGGSTDDLTTVINHALSQNQYEEIMLIGFSLGGNISLKFLAEYGDRKDLPISKAIVFSVPCDLGACAEQLSQGFNQLYSTHFLHHFRPKLKQKILLYPDLNFPIDIDEIKDLKEFSDLILAPLHGFANACDYSSKCSSKHVIKDIAVPVLIVNALNDPFLHPSCFPVRECEKSNYVYLETPTDGGHMGFVKTSLNARFWSEERALEFSQFRP